MLLLVATPLFVSVSFLIQQKLIQKSMQERITEANLVTITIPLNEANWITINKELLIDHKLFDVKSYTITNGNIVAQGLFDDEEDNLVAKVKNTFQEKKQINSPLNQLTIKYLNLQLFNATVSLFNINSNYKTISIRFYLYTEKLTTAYSFLTSPPPKFL